VVHWNFAWKKFNVVDKLAVGAKLSTTFPAHHHPFVGVVAYDMPFVNIRLRFYLVEWGQNSKKWFAY